VGGRVEAVFFCPHAPEDACDCRKPAPGLFRQIGARFGVPLADVPAAGNALRHVQAAAAAGCPTHLLLTGQSAALRDPLLPRPDLPAGTRLHTDLGAFADWLLAQPVAPRPSAP
jgi:D-glycero-D-manno-heptose 1,7-bisphosphate phosphatase